MSQQGGRPPMWKIKHCGFTLFPHFRAITANVQFPSSLLTLSPSLPSNSTFLPLPTTVVLYLFNHPSSYSVSLSFLLPPLVENVQLSLVLQTENKGLVVAGGELNVCLDGMVVDLGSLPNGSTAADSESRLYHTHTYIHTQR